MPYLIADKPLYWAAQNGGTVVISDIAETGGKIGIPPTMTATSNVDVNAYLGAMVGKATGYKPLPDSGWLESGQIYGYGGGLVIVRQSHQRTLFAPADTPALFTVFRADAASVLDWIAGEKVLKGMQRTYNGKTYDVIQDHVTQVDWTPDKAITLWSEVIETPPTGAWAAGVAYKVGDVVTYSGKSYQCLQAHTSISTWMPSAVPALWKLL